VLSRVNALGLSLWHLIQSMIDSSRDAVVEAAAADDTGEITAEFV